ncbi:MAG: hypothetical protein R2684_04460 [Pyrinomonadaceae bacterium]
MKLLILFAVLFSQAALAATPEAAKCRMPDFKEEYESSKAVFVGKVISMESDTEMKHYRFSVEKYWKGIDSKEVTVSIYIGYRGAVEFDLDKAYLVFGKPREGVEGLFDGRCSRTSEIGGTSSTLADDLEALGDAKTFASEDVSQIRVSGEVDGFRFGVLPTGIVVGRLY